MLSLDEALARILAAAPRLPAERVSIDEAAGRVLAEDVVAPFDLPSFDASAMDGYALDTKSVHQGVNRLPVLGESSAGGAAPRLAPGTACRIFTGAPLPEGADTVVMQEHVERDGDVAVIHKPPAAGANIRRRGDDLRKGSVSIAAGTRLRPSHVGLAAACDRAWLEVARRPNVSLVGTGNELTPPGRGGAGRAPGVIPESNGPALRAMAAQAGATPRLFPFAPDDRAATARSFEGALRGADVLVTIGGVSVGDHDLVRPVLEELGATLDFWRVAIKPGKPLLWGKRGDALILGLPGNPTSALVTFAIFGVPLLLAMQGDSHPFPERMRATVGARFSRSAGRTELVRVKVARRREGLVAMPVPNQSSGAATSMAEADALLVVDADRGTLEEGEEADLLWLGELGA